MPLMQVYLMPGRSREKRAALAEALTEAAARVLEAPPETVTVLIQEIPTENWTRGGHTKEWWEAKRAAERGEN